MFAVWIAPNHNSVSYRVLVENATGIFPRIVLEDKLLLAFLYVLPVGLEGHIEDGISSEDKLGWCSACSRVDC